MLFPHPLMSHTPFHTHIHPLSHTSLLSSSPSPSTNPHPCTHLPPPLPLSLPPPPVLYIIYWHDLKLSAVMLGVCLVVLLTLTLNTFLHTIILLMLSFMVVSLTYIVTKIAIDSFYNREIRNPFK